MAHTPIDEAARQIALSAGLAAITLRRLASTAGVTPGVVAEHEPSMSALVATTFDELAAEELDDIEVALASHTTPLAAMRFLVEALLDESHEGYNSVWADAWSLGRRNAALARAATTSMGRWNAVLLRVVAEGVAAGEFADVDPDLVAMQFIALIDATTAYSLIGYRTPADRARLLRRSLEITLGLPEGTL